MPRGPVRLRFVQSWHRARNSFDWEQWIANCHASQGLGNFLNQSTLVLAREMLRDPYWPLHGAQELSHTATWPVQYLRAAPAGSTPRPDLED